MMNDFSFDFAGSRITWSYKALAHLSNSAIFAKWGDTAVNVSVLRGEPREGMNFFPLQIEYLERYYAAGKLMSSPYIKREGFPSEAATLKRRMIDRALRPRFPKGMLDQVQVFINVLSYDMDHDPMLLGFNTAVAALMASDIPFEGEVSGIRVSLDSENVPFINIQDSTALQLSANNETEKMNMVLGLDKNGVVMFDADMDIVTADVVKDGVELARKESETLWKAQRDFAEQVNVKKVEGTMVSVPTKVVEKIDSEYGEKLLSALGVKDKKAREGQISDISKELVEQFNEDEEVTSFTVDEAIAKVAKKYVKKSVLDEGKRVDGRGFDEIRELSAEVGLLQRTHGSGFFKRGNTQVLSIATLTSLANHQVVEDITGEDVRTYMHHYNEMPYVYGEVGRVNYRPNGRGVGHGYLAEKALQPVLPSTTDFPYVIRVVSEVMSASGSTSMASTTGSSLALMDAGVPIKAPVGGITVGVVANEDFSKYQLMLDIKDIEDFYGEMDFKITGTREGITAIQMDQKRLFIPYNVIYESFEVGNTGKDTVIDVIEAAISEPRQELPDSAPKSESIVVDPDKIGKLIGPGGKTIKEIIRVSGADVNVDDDGNVEIFGAPASVREKAREMIESLFEEFKVGEIYDGKIVSTRDFGAICELKHGAMEGKGLIHVSELAEGFVKNVEDVVKVGDSVKVKVVGIDDMGRLKLSLKAASGSKPAPAKEEKAEVA